MQKIECRRLLPLVNIVVYLALIYSGFSNDLKSVFQRRIGLHRPQQAVLVNTAWQEGGVDWNPEHVDYWVPPPHQLAYALNLPANICGVVVGGGLWRGLRLWTLHWGVFWGESVFIAGWTFVFVPVIWVYAGRWIDRRIGILPPVRFRQSRIATTLRMASALGSTLLLIIYVSFATYAIVVAGSVNAIELALMSFCSFWIGFSALVTTSNFRRARLQALANPNA